LCSQLWNLYRWGEIHDLIKIIEWGDLLLSFNGDFSFDL